MKRTLHHLMLLAFCLFGFAGVASAHDGPHTTVQPGDTLSEIAKANNTDVTTLRQLNNLSDSDVVRVGTSLALPGVGESNTDGQQYLVQQGDTLSAIALRHAIPLALLVEVNQISPAQRLYTGQTLQIPDHSQLARQLLPSEHIVQYGETLGMIAARHELSIADLMYFNRLSNGNLLLPGQRLQLKAQAVQGESFAQHVSNLHQLPEQNRSPHPAPPTNEKWIDVDLGQQTVTAYEGAVPVNHFIISSGLPGTPTVTGEFRIWAKTPIQDMYGGNRAAGDYYYLKDVQWVQYFFEDYAFHGAYWHNNFGQPMSRGCINMRNEDAKWLFDWASPESLYSGWLMSDAANPGTLVVVHE